jgi:hypothetical protein
LQFRFILKFRQFDQLPTIQSRHFPPCIEEFGGKSGGKSGRRAATRTGNARRSVPKQSPRFDAFFERLRDLGYVDGQTMAIDYLSANGRGE